MTKLLSIIGSILWFPAWAVLFLTQMVLDSKSHWAWKILFSLIILVCLPLLPLSVLGFILLYISYGRETNAS